ncbi:MULTISPECIES: PilZ domain-containing protein [Novosphingobium]|uniref:PilZ domain-containing protein n=1 Tax=Novosphingobium panipatense TaxID=428991 RepID=A0ABY1Q4N0_9SPHN|nr:MULTISPECIES: PilZ domain-containing protein [Novosphingobium]SMP57745.1 PilZ domain-containing protein [Novosphingobium panipatense]
MPEPDAAEYDCRVARAARAAVSIWCEVRQGTTRPWKAAHLQDLSPEGFRIEHFPEARMQVPLRIRIPGLHLLSARLCWTRNGAAGCEFVEPLHVAVFEHIVRLAA